MSDSTALTPTRPQVVNVQEYAMSVDNVVSQVNLIGHVMRSVMKENEHYGVIPGTKKPSLYKPGAEKLSVTFRLVPKYEIRKNDMANGHREYEVVCSLIHAPTGQFFGQGVGSCSTMEAKYRYHTGEVEFTGKPVPKDYWTERNQDLLGGKGFVAKKNPEGKWEIARKGQRVEHDNPADYFNTVMKMAKKRAHVDAVLTATAASDLFTQDVEDMAENGNIGTGGNSNKPSKDDFLAAIDAELSMLTTREAVKAKGTELWKKAVEYGAKDNLIEAVNRRYAEIDLQTVPPQPPKRGRPPKQPDPPPVEPPPADTEMPEFDSLAGDDRKIECPRSGGEVFESFCQSACPDRQGCPSWPEEDSK